jgi:hypothetical protein
VTDVTNAARTMLMDLATAQWHAPTAEALQIPLELLPPIVSNAQVYGIVVRSVPPVLPSNQLYRSRSALPPPAMRAEGRAAGDRRPRAQADPVPSRWTLKAPMLLLFRVCSQSSRFFLTSLLIESARWVLTDVTRRKGRWRACRSVVVWATSTPLRWASAVARVRFPFSQLSSCLAAGYTRRDVWLRRAATQARRRIRTARGVSCC